jgi:hypothetical protein
MDITGTEIVVKGRRMVACGHRLDSIPAPEVAAAFASAGFWIEWQTRRWFSVPVVMTCRRDYGPAVSR